MLKIYDNNKNPVYGLTEYKDLKIEQEKNITDTLSLTIPKPLGDIIQEEGYIETPDNGNFVIKEKNLTADGYEIIGKYDLEELLEWVDSKAYITEDIITMGEDLLEGTGWKIRYGDEWGRNLIQQSNLQNVTVVDEKSFTAKAWASAILTNDWVIDYLRPNTQYTISYDVILLHKPDWDVRKQSYGCFALYGSQPMVKMAELTLEQYEAMEEGDIIHLEHTFTTPESLEGYMVILYTARHEDEDKFELTEMQFSKVKLEKRDKATPWAPAPEDLTLPKRTVTGTNMSILEFLYKAVDTFKYEIRFDNVSKTIYVADVLGADKGVYFSDQINLKSLTTTSDTYDFATRMIPSGFDGMGIEVVNGGVPYVENHTYSDKIVTVYWSDERYRVPENLKADAEKKLGEICKPLESYSAEVRDLSRYTGYKVLAYGLYDTIELIDRDSKTRQKHRIVKKTVYPDEPDRDEVVIANRPRTLGDEQEKIVEDLRSSFDITKASLELFEDSIKGRVSTVEGRVEDVSDDLDTTKAKVTENTTEIEVLSTGLSSKVSHTELEQYKSEVEDTYPTKIDTDEQIGAAVTEATTTLQSSIEQTDSAIRREVSETYSAKSELEEYRSEISTQFEETSNAFNFNFSNLEERVTTLNGETQSQVQNILKYIRLEDGKIILGEVDNPFVLEIRNDRLCLTQDGMVVAYLGNVGDTQKLYITDGEILSSLKIGNFAFAPRENGNLSFKKVT